MRSRGYFLGGLLPRWFDSDGSFMQKIAASLGWGDMQIYYERAQKIAAFARTDWEKTKEKEDEGLVRSPSAVRARLSAGLGWRWHHLNSLQMAGEG